MKINSAILPTVALALALSVMAAAAQDNEQPRPPRGFRSQQGNEPDQNGPADGQRPRGPRPEGQEGQRPPAPPIIAALDANSDGVIDEKEIANATAALKKLDKNSDGKLTAEEWRPMHPMRDGKGGGEGAEGHRPPRGQGFGRGDNNGPDDGDRKPRRPAPPQGDQ